jgi:transcriptional regulator with XRE-family HTH domain
MFVTYDLKEFGMILKKIRKGLGYSQSDVKNFIGVNEDTIRRIESGYGLPRYDTLELLSVLYKEDLLELLKKNRSCKLLIDYHDKLDYAISSNDIEAIIKIANSFQQNFKPLDNKQDLINQSEMEQFNLLLESIILYNSNCSASDKVSAEICLLKALRLTIPSFNMYNFKVHNYSYIEKRILLLLSLILSEKSEFILSNELLSFILNQLLEHQKKTKYVHLLIIKIYSNLAYNYHMLDLNDKVIEAADQGIWYCLNHDILRTLHILYYRKGIAEYQLGNANYLDSLRNSFFILKLLNKSELLHQYINITKEKYAIIVEPFYN